MGKPSNFAPGPITSQIEHARGEEFPRVVTPFFRQWSQPGLLSLMEATLKDKVFHSTHINGFSTGRLRDPGPKGFLALGRFNQMLAAGECPESHRRLWEGKSPMLSPTGEPLGPAELFLLFVGELSYGLADQQHIPLGAETGVSKAVGRWFRQQLAVKGVDYAVEDSQRLYHTAPTFKELLLGRVISGDALIKDIPALCQEVGCAEEVVWEVINGALQEAVHVPE